MREEHALFDLAVKGVKSMWQKEIRTGNIVMPSAVFILRGESPEKVMKNAVLRNLIFSAWAIATYGCLVVSGAIEGDNHGITSLAVLGFAALGLVDLAAIPMLEHLIRRGREDDS